MLAVRGGVLERITGLPAGTSASKGTLQFPVDRPLSKAVVRRLVRARLDEISDVTNGKRFDFFDDGSLQDIRLTMNAADWQKLHDNYTDKKTNYKADLVWRGLTVASVGVHTRGTGSLKPWLSTQPK